MCFAIIRATKVLAAANHNDLFASMYCVFCEGSSTADFFQWLSQLCIYLSTGDPNCSCSVNWQPALKIGEFRVLISLSTPPQLLWQHIYSRMESALSHPYCSSVLLNCYTVDSRSFYAWSYLGELVNFGKRQFILLS